MVLSPLTSPSPPPRTRAHAVPSVLLTPLQSPDEPKVENTHYHIDAFGSKIDTCGSYIDTHWAVIYVNAFVPHNLVSCTRMHGRIGERRGYKERHSFSHTIYTPPRHRSFSRYGA